MPEDFPNLNDPADFFDDSRREELSELLDFFLSVARSVRGKERYTDAFHPFYDLDLDDLTQKAALRLLEEALGLRGGGIVVVILDATGEGFNSAKGVLHHRLGADYTDILNAALDTQRLAWLGSHHMDPDGLLRKNDDDEGEPPRDFGAHALDGLGVGYSTSELVNFVEVDWQPDQPAGAQGWRTREGLLARRVDVDRAWEWAARVVPLEQRRAFLLTHMLGYTQREAAQLLGVSKSTVAERAAKCTDVMVDYLNDGPVDELEQRRRLRRPMLETQQEAA